MSHDSPPQAFPVAYPQPAFVQAAVDLSCLNPLESLFIKQEIEMLEALTGIETQNKYKIYAKTSPNAPLLYAKEDSDFCARNCLGSMRPFTLNITSPAASALIMKIVRPYKCCLSEAQVYDGTDRLLGSINQVCACCSRVFEVRDPIGNQLYEIYGPCCSPWSFFVRMPRGPGGAEGQAVGEIKKKWSGILKEMLTDADNFGCDFDQRLPKEHKALILAAVFLIDYVYFEDNSGKGSSSF